MLMTCGLDEESIVKASSQFWEQMLAMHLEPAGPDAANPGTGSFGTADSGIVYSGAADSIIVDSGFANSDAADHGAADHGAADSSGSTNSDSANSGTADSDSAECAATGYIAGSDVIGGVHMSGAWNCVIEIVLIQGLEITATAAMLMQPVESVTLADTLDAAKEIANMIAGTIKSALPRPCKMSVPCSSIRSQAAEDAGGCGGDAMQEAMLVALKHESGRLLVRIVESPRDL
jgi:hypothetical protein